MNKKQGAITGLLLLLMGVLFTFQLVVKDKFYNSTLVDNNIGELKEYNISNSNLVYSLPLNWILSVKESDNYILYHGDFRDEVNGYKGYVQLLNSDRDVEELAKSDNNNSIVKTEVRDNTKFNNTIGKGVRYDVTLDIKKGYSYRDIIYYIKVDKDRIIKVNFSVKESEFKNNNFKIYEAILAQIKEKDK